MEGGVKVGVGGCTTTSIRMHSKKKLKRWMAPAAAGNFDTFVQTRAELEENQVSPNHTP